MWFTVSQMPDVDFRYNRDWRANDHVHPDALQCKYITSYTLWKLFNVEFKT